MDYIQVEIVLNPDTQYYRDILIAMLGNIGYESFTENDDNILAYIADTLFSDKDLNILESELPFSFSYVSQLIPDQNWNEVWEKNYFKPLLVANECLVRAPFHTDYPKARYEIVIEPNMAFGTGNHETTSLMIEHILETGLENKTVLDMGCGTAILAILASMKGAKNVIAIDIDKWAYEATIENSKINKCSNITAVQGDAGELNRTQKFDIVFANIQKNVLLNDMDKYYKSMNSKSLIFMSGFYENDIDDITKKAIETGFEPMGYKKKNNWTAAVFCRNNT